MDLLNGLDLFSGIGGIGIALKPWVRTIAYCEQDRYAQGVLMSRMQSGDIDRAPIFTDVRKLQGEHFTTKPDIIFGGFPCQDISVAGLGKGLAGERSGLFYEIIRLTKEINPSFVFLENVPAIRTRGLREVIRAFAEIGYDCRWTCLSAASVGAPHKRERWFLLAHANGAELRNSKKSKCESTSELRYNGDKEPLAYANSAGCLRSYSPQSDKWNGDTKFAWQSDVRGQKNSETWWQTEPDVGRVVDGIPNRVDRIKCLGNSVVPQQVKTAFNILLGINNTF